MKKAQLRFSKIEGRDGCSVNSYIDGRWELETWYPLDEKGYVPCQILLKLSELQQLGYEIDLNF